MVIQRLQSLLLLLAAACMGVYPWVPFGTSPELELIPASYDIPSMILGLATCAIYFIAIFLFKNFKAQKCVVNIGLLVNFITGALVGYLNIAADTNGYSMFWSIGFYLLVAAFILGYWARRRIVKDENLLRSYDRLR